MRRFCTPTCRNPRPMLAASVVVFVVTVTTMPVNIVAASAVRVVNLSVSASARSGCNPRGRSSASASVNPYLGSMTAAAWMMPTALLQSPRSQSRSASSIHACLRPTLTLAPTSPTGTSRMNTAISASVAGVALTTGRTNARSNHRNADNGNNNSDNNITPPPLGRHPPRKICLMVEPTPFTHVSGYANRFKEMLKFLKKAGDQVDILTVDSTTPVQKLPKHHVGYPVHHTQGFTFPLYNHISLSIDLPEMKGARIIETFKPDLIHVTSPGVMLFAAIFYARVLRIPLVMSYHTHLPTYGRNYLGFIPYVEQICFQLVKWAHSRADLTLVTSPQMRDELQANGVPRIEVWRKGIDTERFHPKFYNVEMRTKMTNGNPNDFLMVYVGRLGAEKRLKDIKAMMGNMAPNTRLCIVGKGPQEAELKDWFPKTNTVFMGQLVGDELSQAFASADVFVMPSDSETLGFVVLESMASGVPVVGAAAGGIPDLIENEANGFLCEPGNTDQFVQRLNQLRDVSFRTKIGKAARIEAERWGWEAATSYLRNIQYEKALINFHSRAFGGFGRPGTASVWRLLRWRIRSIMKQFKQQVQGVQYSIQRGLVQRFLPSWCQRYNNSIATVF